MRCCFRDSRFDSLCRDTDTAFLALGRKNAPRFDSRIRPSIARRRSTVDRRGSSRKGETNECARLESVLRRSSAAVRGTPRTHRSRIIHEDVRLHPFLLRGARLRQGTSLARVHDARAKPDRRDGRNAGASDAEFSWRLRPGERGERTRRPAFARTRSTRVVRVRGIVRSNARIPHRGAPEHLLYAPIRATPDATQTLLSGFGGPHHRLAALFRPSKDARARRTTNHERRSPPSITITVTVTVTHRSPRARPLRKRAAAAPSR